MAREGYDGAARSICRHCWRRLLDHAPQAVEGVHAGGESAAARLVDALVTVAAAQAERCVDQPPACPRQVDREQRIGEARDSGAVHRSLAAEEGVLRWGKWAGLMW